MDKNEKITAYEFYRLVLKGEDRLIGTLPERRKDLERITHTSIMNLAKIIVPKDDFNDRAYFIRVKFKRGVMSPDYAEKS